MALKSKRIHIPKDVSQLPHYPFGDLVSEPLADYAARTGKKVNTIRKQADRGHLPILQTRPGAPREVNLYALYLQARHQAERYVTMAMQF